jgi:shikimate kinase
MKGNVLLIGFMGVGKGTTARAFSKKYGVFAIDTDDLIESLENKKIKKIFQSNGEEYFRELEQKCANWISSSVKNTLISCGGGFYKVKNLKELGSIILLDASFEWIYSRLKNSPNSQKKLAKRPLFADPKRAKELYDFRIKEYKKVADIVIDLEKLSFDEVLETIYQETFAKR